MRALVRDVSSVATPAVMMGVGPGTFGRRLTAFCFDLQSTRDWSQDGRGGNTSKTERTRGL